MGGKTSKQIVDMSAEEIAAKVEELGAAYSGYKSSVIENALDGALLLTLKSDGEAKEVVTALGVTNIIHQRKLVSVILEAVRSQSNHNTFIDLDTKNEEKSLKVNL